MPLNHLAVMLERSARDRAAIARELAGRGYYQAALFHYSVAVRLRLQAMLSALNPSARHTCSIAATLAAILQRLKGLERLHSMVKGFYEGNRAIIARLDAAYRGIVPASPHEASRLCREAERVFQEAGRLLAALREPR